MKKFLAAGLFIAGLASLAAAGYLAAGQDGTQDALPESAVPLTSQDKKDPTTEATAVPPVIATVDNRIHVTIEDGSRSQAWQTKAETIAQVLLEAGITLFPADHVWPDLEAKPSAGMIIQITRSFPVTVIADGRTIQFRTAQANSMDILLAAGINLVGYDYARPGPNDRIQAGDTIQVIRVTEDFRTEDRALPFQTIWQANPDLELDQQTVLTAGVPGIQRRRYRQRYENGVLIGETLDGEWTAREPVNQVVGYGTHIVTRILETPTGPVEYWRVVRMRVTSYTAASSGKEPDDPWYGITASGVRVRKGIVAVDRSIVPFKSYVYVPGYGLGYAGDTGGGVRGRWIDLGYGENDFQWWKGYVDVYYLTPVPPPEDINYLLPSVLP